MLWIRTLIYAWRRKQLRSSSPKDLKRILHNTRTTWNPLDPTICQLADWSLSAYGAYGELSKQPRTVFVKGDREFDFFIDRVLPLIKPSTRFVLISADTDLTLPRQTDKRSPSYEEIGLYDRLMRLASDSRIVSWYTENLDIFHPRFYPLPLGCHESRERNFFLDELRHGKPISMTNKRLRAICAHRTREGAQWEKRKAVTELCKNQWSGCVDYFEFIPNDSFRATLSGYPFVICVGGGGLDPSPKAWVAMLSGAIPIIERNPTTVGYADLPVVFVDEWNEQTITKEKLSEWLENLAPYFEDQNKRRAVLEKLSLGYWFETMLMCLDDQPPIDVTKAG